MIKTTSFVLRKHIPSFRELRSCRKHGLSIELCLAKIDPTGGILHRRIKVGGFRKLVRDNHRQPVSVTVVGTKDDPFILELNFKNRKGKLSYREVT